MDNTLKVTCPCCDTILIVDRRSGKVIEQRKPIVEETTGDRFEDAFKKVKGATAAAEAKFEEARKQERERKKKIEALFEEGLKRVKESGDTSRPDRDFDFD